MNKCLNCNQLIHSTMAVIDGKDVFCSDHCHNAYTKRTEAQRTHRCTYCHCIRKEVNMCTWKGLWFCSVSHLALVKNRS